MVDKMVAKQADQAREWLYGLSTAVTSPLLHRCNICFALMSTDLKDKDLFSTEGRRVTCHAWLLFLCVLFG